MKVLRVITNVGVFVDAIKTVDSEKHHCSMELLPAGVLIQRPKFDPVIVPFHNVAWLVVAPAVKDSVVSAVSASTKKSA